MNGTGDDIAPADLVPRAAPLWPGLLVGLAGGAAAWALLDPAAPPERRAGFAWAWFAPYAVVGVGTLALAAGAVWDLVRVWTWAAERPTPWAERAAQWCRDRTPAYSLPEHVRNEVTRVREELDEAVAARWGKYYLLGFALPAVAFLAGWWYLKAEPPGPAVAPLFHVFGPLAAATLGAGAALAAVVVAARTAAHVTRTWALRTDAAVRHASRDRAAPPAAVTFPLIEPPSAGGDSGVIDRGPDPGGDGGGGGDAGADGDVPNY